MISIPVAVHHNFFEWQLNLFWFNHRLTYGEVANDKVLAVIIKRNTSGEPKHETMDWDLDIPHEMCESFFDVASQTGPTDPLHMPLNIQVGLRQILRKFSDDQVIEVLDCDMFHFRRHPSISVGNDELLVCDFYEQWHLKSLAEHKDVIEGYLVNGGGYYNGGFVPIIGKVRTFRRILYAWTAIHERILAGEWPDLIKWWAGMYALQAACENERVTMRARNYCYIPGINRMSPEQYIAHYACDAKFDKKKYPSIRIEDFGDNEFYRRLLLWPRLPGNANLKR